MPLADAVKAKKSLRPMWNAGLMSVGIAPAEGIACGLAQMPLGTVLRDERGFTM